jgi:hypothetical protein
MAGVCATMNMDPAYALNTEGARRRTVLWLRGTGINAWHYYGFLKQFSLEQLSQFKKIVCVSGGAAVFWVYVLSLRNQFDESIVDRYDEIVRRVMNRSGIVCRTKRILSFHAPYLASQQRELLSELVSKESFGWTFSQFPLSNFRVLVARENVGYRELGDAGIDDALQVAAAIAVGGTPLSGQDLQIDGIDADCFDFELATTKCRKAYQRELIARFSQERKLILNTTLQISDASGNCSYLCFTPDKYAGLMRTLDSARLFLDLPSDRYRKVFKWSCQRTLALPPDR